MDSIQLFSANEQLILRQIDVDDKGSLDKATVISALQANGEADYDSVSSLFLPICKPYALF